MPGNTEPYESRTLLSYTGYLTTPSAYITDAQLSLSYSYFSQSFPLTEYISGKNSEIWIFAASLGYFPFLETFFSVYVLPSDTISDRIFNYGANKWRSFGIKLKILDEKKYTPAVAIGIYDPDLKKFGAKKTSPNVSSSFIVFSKHFGVNKMSFSVGYGFDYFARDSDRIRLKNLFGGSRFNITRTISLLCDYDGRMWSGGGMVRWHNFDCMLSITEGVFLATRIGYGLDLL